MGQYYTPVLRNKDGQFQTLSCYDYDNGAKLMEHSYLGNRFVETVVKQILNKPKNLAWVGDYADEEDANNEATKQVILDFLKNQNTNCIKPKKASTMENSLHLYFLDLTTHEYISIREYVQNDGFDSWGYVIHPLPLLTSIGNGKGGGDYRGINEEMLGRWAGHLIKATSYIDTKKYQEVGWKDITPLVKFSEGR